MKRTLSLVLALVMVLGSFSAVFAVDAVDKVEAGDFLELAGVLTGDEKGNLMLDNTLLRRDMVVMLSRLMGVEGTAKEFPAEELTFEDITDAFYNGYIAWAVNNEFIKGLSEDLFGFNNNVTAQQYATVLMRALGYEVDTDAAYATVVADAKALGLLADVEVEGAAEITRGQMAVMTFNTLGTAMKDSETTLAESLKIEMPEPEVPAVLEVEEVYADNLKQVNVVYNQKVDEKTATNKDNYTLKKAIAMETLELMEDGMTVVITLDKAETAVFKMQDEYTLKINNVKTLDGTQKVSKEEIKFKPVDVTVPTVTEIIGLGTKAIKVIFSEPIKMSPANSTSSYKIDDKYVGGTAKYVFANEVILSTNMTVGEHTLSVKDIKDFNNYTVDEKGFTFYVEEDNEAPEIVKAYSKDLNEAVVEFNEPIKAVSKAYHGSKSNSATVKIEGNKVTLTFANEMSLGSTTLYLEGVQDYSDNKADRNVTIEPELDMTRPEVVEVKVKDGKDFTISFNKKLKQSDAEDKENYTIKKSDGTLVTKYGLDGKGHPIVKPKFVTGSEDKKIEFSLVKELPEGDYILEVSGVRDTAKVANVIIPYSYAFDVGNVKTLGISKVWTTTKNISGTEYVKEIFVQFNKDVTVEGNGNALVVAKYNYSSDGITYKTMPDDTKIELVANDVVKLVIDKDLKIGDEIKDSDLGYIRAVSIGDKEDKISTLLSKDKTTNKATIKSVKALEVDEIEVTFEGEVSVVETDFTVNSKDLTLKNHTKNSDNNTVATFKFKDNDYKLPENVGGLNLTVKASPDSTDNFGNKLQNGDTTITDKIRPTVTESVYKSGDTIVIKFNENIELDSNKAIQNDKIKISVADVEYKIADSATGENVTIIKSGQELIITFASSVLVTEKIVTVTYSDDNSTVIRDAEGNGAKAFSKYLKIN